MSHESDNRRPVLLITGGAGFLGSRLVHDLAEDPDFKGYTLRIYDNLYRGIYYGLLDLPEESNVEFIEGDILDRENLKRAMEGAEAVVHLAAIVRTPITFDNPSWMDQVNHWGTASVVETALASDIKRLVYTSSASVYGPGGPFVESDKCHPVGVYSNSKLRGEREVQAAFARGLEGTILRLGSAFGCAPAMRFDVMASRFVYLAGIGQPLTVFGEGSQTRPLLHVSDVSRAIKFSLTHPETIGQTYNVAAHNPSVNELADTLRSIKSDTRVRYTDQDVLTRISFALDSSKYKNAGFNFEVNLETGLREMLRRWSLKPFVPDAEFDFNETD